MGSGRLPAARVVRRRRSGEGDHNSLTMPLMLELKYEHFIGTWPGRIKCVELFLAHFWFTAGATFAYFTAFVAMLVNFSEREDGDWQYWIDANIAAGVFGLLNDVFYGLGAYLIYVEWKANPTGAPAPPPA